MRHNYIKFIISLFILILIYPNNYVIASDIGFSKKSNFTLGGNLTYKSITEKSLEHIDETERNIQFFPTIGYFIKERVLLSVTPYILHFEAKDVYRNSSENDIAIGIGLKYYYPILKKLYANIGGEIAAGFGISKGYENKNILGARLLGDIGMTYVVGSNEGAFVSLSMNYEFLYLLFNLINKGSGTITNYSLLSSFGVYF